MVARLWFVFIALFATAPISQAAVFCATSSAGLQDALDTAESNGQNDEIRIAVGIYEVPISDGFTYSALAAGGDDFNLTISGGWSAFFDNPCGQQLAADNAFNTLIDGDDRFRGLTILARQGSDITVRNLWFANGDASDGAGGGLMVFSTGATGTNTFLIENCVFSGNAASTSAALSLIRGNEIRVRNNLFLANNATSASYAVGLSSLGPGIYFTNNTVIDNTVTVAGQRGGVLINASSTEFGANQYFVANNILWGNQGGDILLANSAAQDYFIHNDLGFRFGTPAENEFGNISIAPQYESSLIDFIPIEGSPLINAGVRPPNFVPVPPPFHQAWSTGVIDLKGGARVRGGEIDIGAYEAKAPLLNDGFE
jgi:hypothetical protein